MVPKLPPRAQEVRETCTSRLMPPLGGEIRNLPSPIHDPGNSTGGGGKAWNSPNPAKSEPYPRPPSIQENRSLAGGRFGYHHRRSLGGGGQRCFHGQVSIRSTSAFDPSIATVAIPICEKLRS
eukprot:7980617-Pyramimonas_sp.AAC.1